MEKTFVPIEECIENILAIGLANVDIVGTDFSSVLDKEEEEEEEEEGWRKRRRRRRRKRRKRRRLKLLKGPQS